MTATTQDSTLDALIAEARSARQRSQELQLLIMLNRWHSNALIKRAHQLLRACARQLPARA